MNTDYISQCLFELCNESTLSRCGENTRQIMGVDVCILHILHCGIVQPSRENLYLLADDGEMIICLHISSVSMTSTLSTLACG